MYIIWVSKIWISDEVPQNLRPHGFQNSAPLHLVHICSFNCVIYALLLASIAFSVTWMLLHHRKRCTIICTVAPNAFHGNFCTEISLTKVTEKCMVITNVNWLDLLIWEKKRLIDNQENIGKRKGYLFTDQM